MRHIVRIVALLMAALIMVTSCQAPDSSSQLTSETVDVSFAGPSARTITTDDGLVQTVATSDLWFQYKAVWQGSGNPPSTATNEWTRLSGPGLAGTVKLHRGTWELSLRAFVNETEVGEDGKFILSGSLPRVEIGANNLVTQTVSISLGYVRQEGNGTLHVSATYPVVYHEAANPGDSPVEAVRKVKVTANVAGTDYTGNITAFDSNNVGTLDLTVPAGAAHVTVEYYMDESNIFEGDSTSTDVLIMAYMTTNLNVEVDRNITAITFNATQPEHPESQYPVLNFNSVLDIYPDNLENDTAFVIGYSVEETKAITQTPITFPYTIISDLEPDENGRYNASSLGLVPITVPDDSALDDSLAKEAWLGKNASIAYNDTALEAIKIMDGATVIEDISDCRYLKSVYIPNTVESIDTWAFECNYALESIEIPDSVVSLGANAFNSCDALKTVKIGNGVTVIEERTFYECESLESVICGNNIAEIKSEAFFGCYNLKNINLPESLTTIGERAFSDCGFTSITIPSGVTRIEDYTFQCCNNLLSIVIPDSVTYIGQTAVGGCEKLVSVTIGKGANYIYSDTFSDSPALETIIVSEDNATYTSIDGVLIDKVNSLLMKYPENKKDETYTIPDSVTTIGYEAFKNNNHIKSVTIPNTVTEIYRYVFSDCTELRSATLENGLTCVGYGMFSNCKKLSSVNIPSSVTTIYALAFNDCTGLEDITIPDGVTTIGGSAFAGCSGLTSISIPDSVTSIGVNAFGNCSNLMSIDVSENNSTFASMDGILMNKTKTQLLSYPGGKAVGSYIVPDNVTYIGESAFSRCNNITSIVIPDSVTSIGRAAFYGFWEPYHERSKLKTITIGNGLTSVGDYAFENCDSLTDIYINKPESTLFNKAAVPSGCRIHWNSTGPEATGSV